MGKQIVSCREFSIEKEFTTGTNPASCYTKQTRVASGGWLPCLTLHSPLINTAAQLIRSPGDDGYDDETGIEQSKFLSPIMTIVSEFRCCRAVPFLASRSLLLEHSKSLAKIRMIMAAI